MKKPVTEQDLIVRDRLIMLRKMNNETQSQAAAAADISMSTLRRYENGEYPWKSSAMLKLAKHYNAPVAYIRGESKSATWGEYEDEMQEFWTKEIQAEAKKYERMRLFFELCGVEYDDRNYTADKGCYEQRYCLTPFECPSSVSHFSQGELDNLLEKIHDLIAFECWKKQQARGKDDK